MCAVIAMCLVQHSRENLIQNTALFKHLIWAITWSNNSAAFEPHCSNVYIVCMCILVPPFSQVATGGHFYFCFALLNSDRMLELRTGAGSAPSAVCALSGSWLSCSLIRLNDLLGWRGRWKLFGLQMAL